MSEALMFREALSAIEEGDKARARDLLARLLRADKSKPEYWLWMSSVVDTKNEQIYCLRTAYRLDPGSVAARRGLVMLGAEPPDDRIVPTKPVPRNWEAELEKETAPPSPDWETVRSNPIVRVLTLVGVVGLGIIVYLYGFSGRRGLPFFGRQLTITPIPWTLTPSVTPSRTPVFRTLTPTSDEAIPLWMLLDATYTPTPLYVNTPHPRTEAYRAGLRAFERDDYEAMLTFMQQASRDEPDSADTQYYVGEAYRLLGEHERAMEAYERALDADIGFAPAYLGRAKLNLMVSPGANVLEDIELAIEHDPNYGEAYLMRVDHWLNRGDYELAKEDLPMLEDLLPDSALRYLYQAQISLALGQEEAALENALQAYELDITMLPVYLVLGQAYLVNGEPKEALDYLETYVRYEEEDPLLWTSLGKAYYQIGEDYQAALEALDLALDLDDELYDAYLYRGLTNLALGEGQDAVNDLYNAHNLASDSFEISLAFGRSLFATERYSDAYAQINASLNLTRTLKDSAEVYYWSALSLEAMGRQEEANENWLTLWELPENVVPEEWLVEADLRLNPPTATVTSTLTPTKTDTPTSTVTPSPTITLTPSPTQTATRTPTDTVTPSPTTTRTQIPTRTTISSPTPSLTPTP